MVSLLLSVTFACGVFIAIAHVLNQRFIAPVYDVAANLTAFGCAVGASVLLGHPIPAALAGVAIVCWLVLARRTVSNLRARRAREPRISPIFPVRDVAAALKFYASLGFTTRAYEGAEYGFAVLDDAELHLGGPPHRREAGPHSAYLYVDNADELAERWTKTGADVRTPVDTPWGQHEGVLIDLDGNVVRFGSPMS